MNYSGNQKNKPDRSYTSLGAIYKNSKESEILSQGGWKFGSFFGCKLRELKRNKKKTW